MHELVMTLNYSHTGFELSIYETDWIVTVLELSKLS